MGETGKIQEECKCTYFELIKIIQPSGCVHNRNCSMRYDTRQEIRKEFQSRDTGIVPQQLRMLDMW